MLPKKNTAILVGLCSALAACDGTPGRDLMAPEEAGAGTLDAQSASLLAPSNTWVVKRSLLTTRFDHRAGTLNNVIYVVGGRRGSPTGITVEAYNVATNTWTPLSSLEGAVPEFFNGVSAIGGKLYMTGGSQNSKFLLVYTPPGSSSWVRKADMPHPGGGCGAQGVIRGLLYVYVGCSAINQGAENKLYRYDRATDTWITLAPAPTTHAFGEGGVIGGEFYLVGGGANQYQLDVYNPATNTWRTRAPMPVPARSMASAVVNGKLYVAGGDIGGSRTAVLRVYNPGTNRWTTKAPLPTQWYRGAGAAAGGLFFVTGGLEGAGQASRKLRVYTP